MSKSTSIVSRKFSSKRTLQNLSSCSEKVIYTLSPAKSVIDAYYSVLLLTGQGNGHAFLPFYYFNFGQSPNS